MSERLDTPGLQGRFPPVINRAQFASAEALKSTLDMGLIKGMRSSKDR